MSQPPTTSTPTTSSESGPLLRSQGSVATPKPSVPRFDPFNKAQKDYREQLRRQQSTSIPKSYINYTAYKRENGAQVTQMYVATCKNGAKSSMAKIYIMSCFALFCFQDMVLNT